MLTIGANHRTATAARLGEFTLAAERLKGELRDGGPRKTQVPVHELAVLATCNRVEVYVAADDAVADEAAQVLGREVFGTEADPGRGDAPYQFRGVDVVRHVCRVAAGLDSMVVGEHQIAGQVTRAFQDVVYLSESGKVLESVAAAARKASRRVRSETGLGRYPASVSSVAVDLAREKLGDLSGRRVLVVGAGKAGLLVCKALKASGVASLTVVNRSPGRAREVAREVDGTVASLEELRELLTTADLVITATGADNVVLDLSAAKAALATRDIHSSPLLVLDLALPSDVDPVVGELDGIELLTLEDVKDRVERHLSLRRDEVEPAEAVVDAVVHDFVQQQAAPDVEALISELRRSIDEVRSLEVQRWLATRRSQGAPSREELDRLTRSIVNKLLHDPMIRLRSAPSRNGGGETFFRAASELLGLEVESYPAPTSSTE